MSRPRRLALLTSLSIILAACSTDSTQDSAQTGTSTKSGTVEFSEGLSVRELSELLRTSKMNVEYALFTQTVAGEETVGGVLLEGKDLGKLEDTLRESTEGFIADMALTDEKGGRFEVLAKQERSAVDAPRITGITGEFSQTDLTKLKSDRRVSKLLFEPENSQPSSPAADDLELETQVARGPGKLWSFMRSWVTARSEVCVSSWDDQLRADRLGVVVHGSLKISCGDFADAHALRCSQVAEGLTAVYRRSEVGQAEAWAIRWT